MEYWNGGEKIKYLNPLFHHSIIPTSQYSKATPGSPGTKGTLEKVMPVPKEVEKV
jgi:hypothetical protein